MKWLWEKNFDLPIFLYYVFLYLSWLLIIVFFFFLHKAMVLGGSIYTWDGHELSLYLLCLSKF